MSNSLGPHGLYSPWNSPGQNTGVSSRSLLQGIFPTQKSNPGLPHWRQILYQLNHQGSPRITEWVAYPLSSRSSQPRLSRVVRRSFTNWAIREAQVNFSDLYFHKILSISNIFSNVLTGGIFSIHLHWLALLYITYQELKTLKSLTNSVFLSIYPYYLNNYSFIYLCFSIWHMLLSTLHKIIFTILF